MFEGRKLGEQKGTCVYEETDPEQPADDPIGRPVAHQSAIEHVTGTAVYVDDYPQYKGMTIRDSITRNSLMLIK